MRKCSSLNQGLDVGRQTAVIRYRSNRRISVQRKNKSSLGKKKEGEERRAGYVHQAEIQRGRSWTGLDWLRDVCEHTRAR